MSGLSKAFKMNNGLMMPAIGLGTWQSAKGQVYDAVKCALHCGYRHIDCAHIYGNEDEIGQALKDVFAEEKIKREDIFITSKLWCNSMYKEEVIPALTVTLKNLQLDYLDMYLLHLPVRHAKTFIFPPNRNVEYDEIFPYKAEHVHDVWEEMEEAVNNGLSKSIGVSNFTCRKLQDLLEKATIVPANNQVELHPYLPQEKLKSLCEEKGILLSAYSPLGSPARQNSSDSDPVLLEDPRVVQIAEKHNSTPAQVLIAWSVKRGIPVLPKSVTESRIQCNFEASKLNLDDEDMKALSNTGIHQRYLLQNWQYKQGQTAEEYWDGEQ